MNIVLSGMPGSGKTTVAAVLAEKYGGAVWDTDSVIVREHGAISDIFAKHGEEYFRNLETAAVEKVCAENGAVIATGGGCLLREENVRLLKSSGKIVYLRTQFETLLDRLNGDTSRPLLQGDARSKLAALYNARTPIYERAADITVDTDGLTPEEIAEKIYEAVRG